RLRLDHLSLALADRDLPRLLVLRNLAHEIDVQETVLEAGAANLDMVGELEATLEGAGSDALIEHVAIFLLLRGFLFTADRQRVLLHLDVEFLLGEAGDRNRNAVRVLPGALDVVGRIGGIAAVYAAERVEQREQPVKTDGRTIERGEIESSHGISSFEATCVARRNGRAAGRAAEWP